jgi:hypothetical protein
MIAVALVPATLTFTSVDPKPVGVTIPVESTVATPVLELENTRPDGVGTGRLSDVAATESGILVAAPIVSDTKIVAFVGATNSCKPGGTFGFVKTLSLEHEMERLIAVPKSVVAIQERARSGTIAGRGVIVWPNVSEGNHTTTINEHCWSNQVFIVSRPTPFLRVSGRRPPPPG